MPLLSSKIWSCRTVPLRRGVFAVEGVFQLDNVSIAFPQEVVLLGVVLDQFSQRGEFLPSVQVIIVPRVLDFNMGDLIVPPAQNKQMGHNREKAGREEMRDDRQDGKDGKDR